MEENNLDKIINKFDLKNVVFRLMDFSFPELDATKISHYEFITDETVRRQLELDFLKMMHTQLLILILTVHSVSFKSKTF